MATVPMPASAQAALPGVLRHLHCLTRTFTYRGRRISYINIYARPTGTRRNPQFEFIMARESGLEGIACVDDVARAAILALRVYEQTGQSEALDQARAWLTYVEYMQEADGRFTNFIVDEFGAKNLRGQTSRIGGTWWSARAMWALAMAWRITRDPRYLRRLRRGRLAPTSDMKIKALHALALMETYSVEPSTKLMTRICTLCDAIIASGPGYFRDRVDKDSVCMWGYHQLEAVARAGKLFSRLDYIVACEETVKNLVEPVIAGGFYHEYPDLQDQQCVYDVSTLGLGLEALYNVTHQPALRDLARTCAAWLDGNNPAGVVVYDPRTGCCSDGVTDGQASLNCGAESSIEAGLLDLMRRRLRFTVGPRRLLAAAAPS